MTILALGPTQTDYHADAFSYTPQARGASEIWTLNKGFRSLRADCVFILDDLIGERRKSEPYYQDICSRLASMPVITSVIDHDVREQYAALQNLSAYPITELLDFYGFRILEAQWRQVGQAQPFTMRQIRQEGMRVAAYLKNSIPMILAYAGMIGVKEVHLWGADYDFPGHAAHEKDKPNTEYWVGLLFGLFGLKIRMSTRTTLLSTHEGRTIYGYGVRQPNLDLPDDGSADQEFTMVYSTLEEIHASTENKKHPEKYDEKTYSRLAGSVPVIGLDPKLGGIDRVG